MNSDLSDGSVRPQIFMNEEGESHEASEVKIKRAPDEPTLKEIEEHYARGHVPYRNWCKHCVMGQAKNSQHRAITGEEQAITTVSMDYGFMTEDVESQEDENEEEKVEVTRASMTMGVVQESLLNSIWTYPVEVKGAGEKLACRADHAGLRNGRLEE